MVLRSVYVRDSVGAEFRRGRRRVPGGVAGLGVAEESCTDADSAAELELESTPETESGSWLGSMDEGVGESSDGGGVRLTARAGVARTGCKGGSVGRPPEVVGVSVVGAPQVSAGPAVAANRAVTGVTRDWGTGLGGRGGGGGMEEGRSREEAGV